MFVVGQSFKSPFPSMKLGKGLAILRKRRNGKLPTGNNNTPYML